MNLNFDKVLAALVPWDATISVGSKAYALRPLTLGDVARLEAVGQVGKPQADAGEFVAGLFGSEAPPIGTSVERTLIAGSILRLFKEHLGKNPEAIASALDAAVEIV
jgi:hypothetical protein